jgi:deazaflavin-dependent oxidoreductase (nitroreductase family)
MRADQKDYNQKLIDEFRANKGGGPMAGRALLLLTTTGAKTGQRRTTPMMYIPDGDRILVIASNAGALKHPDRYYNVVAHPEVTVEVANETYNALAVVPQGAERQRLWDQVVAQYPFFADHQAKMERVIPVVVLQRRKA